MFAKLRRDERGIEGLPIRLVIALVVGVASLSIMLNMLSGLSGLAVSEVDVRPTPEVTTLGGNATNVTVDVVDPEGAPVADATVIARSGTARLSSVETARTDENGTARLALAPRLGPNQPDGTVTFEVKPPAGAEYVDRRANTELLVVRGRQHGRQ